MEEVNSATMTIASADAPRPVQQVNIPFVDLLTWTFGNPFYDLDKPVSSHILPFTYPTILGQKDNVQRLCLGHSPSPSCITNSLALDLPRCKLPRTNHLLQFGFEDRTKVNWRT